MNIPIGDAFMLILTVKFKSEKHQNLIQKQISRPLEIKIESEYNFSYSNLHKSGHMLKNSVQCGSL